MDIEKVRVTIEKLKQTVEKSKELSPEKKQFYLNEILKKEQMIREYELPEEIREEAYYVNKLNQYSFKDKDDKKTLTELFNYFFSYEKSVKYANYLFKQYKDLEQIFKFQNIQSDTFLDEDTKKIMRTLISIKEQIEMNVLEPDQKTKFCTSGGIDRVTEYFYNNYNMYFKKDFFKIVYLNAAGCIETLSEYPEKIATAKDFLNLSKVQKLTEFMITESIRNKAMSCLLTVYFDMDEIWKQAGMQDVLDEKQMENTLSTTEIMTFCVTMVYKMFEYIKAAYSKWASYQCLDILIYVKYKEKSYVFSLLQIRGFVSIPRNITLQGVSNIQEQIESIYTVYELFCKIDKSKCLSSSTFYNLDLKRMFLTDVEYLRTYNISEKILSFINLFSQILYKIFFLPVKQIIAKDIKAFLTSDQVKIYLLSFFAYRKVENFSVIFLTENNEIIRHEILSIGTVGMASVYVDEIGSIAVSSKAKKLIFIHNHPGGTDDFSEADINMTKSMLKALSFIGVQIIDHFLIAGNKIKSMYDENPRIFR